MRAALAGAGLAWLAAAGPAAGADGPDFAAQRAWLVEWLAIEAAQSESVTGIAELDPRVLAAIGRVPRERFVPEPIRDYSYLPQPLPVHPEQNLAAPFLAALMLDLAGLEPGDTVLETGTDTGYNAALLAGLVERVYSIELIPELATGAAATLRDLGLQNVEVREGDGYFGWPEHAPYDAIIVKEQLDHLPAPLLAQLRPGGRLVLPLGGPDEQMLTVVEKRPDGRLIERHVLPVRFSPLQGGERI